jgi:hypothetical protein
MKKIGGEFQIEYKQLIEIPHTGLYSEKIYFSNGRNALKYILIQLKTKEHKSTIHVPYFICKSVIETVINLGYKINFYEVSQKYELPEEYIETINEHDLVILVNYFGFSKNKIIIQKIKNYNSNIVCIEDSVQAIYEQEKSNADFTFNSFRKFFAVPDGASITYKTALEKPNQLPQNKFHYHKLIGGILKTLKPKDTDFLDLFAKGENLIDDEKGLSGISTIGCWIYENTNKTDAQKRRKENYKLLYDIGKESNIKFLFDYDPHITPLNIPIIINNRDKIRNELFRQNIFLPIHWKLDSFNKNSLTCQYISENELSLVIDQRYNSEDIIREMDALLKLINKYNGNIL